MKLKRQGTKEQRNKGTKGQNKILLPVIWYEVLLLHMLQDIHHYEI